MSSDDNEYSDEVYREAGKQLLVLLAIGAVVMASFTGVLLLPLSLGAVDIDTHAGVASAQTEDAPDGTVQGPVNTGSDEDEDGADSADNADNASGNESTASDTDGPGDETIENGSAPAGAGQGYEGNPTSDAPGSGQDQGVGASATDEGVVPDPNESEIGNETIENGSAPAGAGQGSDGTPVSEQTPAGGQGQGAGGTAAEDGVPTASDDDDGGIGFVAQQVISMIEGLTTKASQEFGAAVELLFEYGATRAAPGEAEFSIEAVDSWTNPDDPLWQGSMDGMSIARGFGIILVIFAVWYGITGYGLNPSRSKSIFATSAVSAVFLINPAFWTALSIHGTNAISLAIVPGEETYATPEGILLVLSTALLAGLLAAGSLWVVALAIVVTVLAHNATHVTMALLPIAAGLYPYPMYFRSLAQMIIWLHGAALATGPLQALGTFITTRMFFASTEAGALESMTGVFAFLGLIYIAYYKIPKEIFEKAFDAPITSLGTNGARMSLDGAQNLKARISNAPEAFKEMKTRIESRVESARSTVSRSDPAPAPTPRSVGQVTASSTAGGSGGSDGRTPTAMGAGSHGSSGSGSGFNARSRPEPSPRSRERDRIGSGYY